MTIERARRFARAYIDEFGPKGVFEMSMPSELELEMVAAVLVKELECDVTFTELELTIKVQMPWFKFVDPSLTGTPAAGYIS
ncbi:MAG TPA: hypothetical protein VGL56_20735 [Fimbriimonadaceae bacterium]